MFEGTITNLIVWPRNNKDRAFSLRLLLGSDLITQETPIMLYTAAVSFSILFEMAGFRLESWRNALNQNGAPKLNRTTIASVPKMWGL